ncbi:cobyrinate a,c-diamide synthase [Paenibacillus chartarius]|uniref:Cobyrinate a,c-diamide synthase n=1 Tax=Paenibacillus chartarius TaxID=747481 RepID=A0ABV6DVJ3_9BACL
MQRRLLIAGTGSGVGKTTLTIGLMAALRSRGLTVQGFKCGPDYIDPTYHTAVTGRQSRNLDTWMLERSVMKDIYNRASADADISVIEGVMGLFDGKDHLSNEGSAADIAMELDCPVVLVVNCQSMARSAAAVVKGFQHFAPGLRIAGVIANKVGSAGHYQMVQEAITQECGLKTFGYLPRDNTLAIPERHLGLVPSVERGELDSFFAKLGDHVAETIDIDAMLEASRYGDIHTDDPSGASSIFEPAADRYTATIAAARDAAFNFYYPENFELLQAYGAELRFFSPLAGEPVPADADGLYIGGGFPEEFAQILAGDGKVKESVLRFIEQEQPVLAECGGFMYLTEVIVDREGQRYPMVGAIPGYVQMQSKLAALGYREVTGSEENRLFGEGLRARGHEFHYSIYQAPASPLPAAYKLTGRGGAKAEGVVYKKLIAGYTHIHFGSAPELAKRYVKACSENNKLGTI